MYTISLKTKTKKKKTCIVSSGKPFALGQLKTFQIIDHNHSPVAKA